MRCDEVEAAVQEAMGGPLPAEVSAHLEHCDACAELAADLMTVDAALRYEVDVPAMPVDLVPNIMAAVQAQPRRIDLVAVFVLVAAALFAAWSFYSPDWLAWTGVADGYLQAAGDAFIAMLSPLTQVWSDFWGGSWGDVSMSNGLLGAALFAMAMVGYLNLRWARTQAS